MLLENLKIMITFLKVFFFNITMHQQLQITSVITPYSSLRQTACRLHAHPPFGMPLSNSKWQIYVLPCSITYECAVTLPFFVLT